MDDIILLRKRVEECPEEERGAILLWIEKAERRMQRNVDRFKRYLVCKGFSLSDPMTHYYADVLAGRRGN